MHLKSRPLLRALGLLWGRMGPARIYLLAAASALFVLAAVGVVHLVSSGAAWSEKSQTKRPTSKTGSDPAVEVAIPDDPVIAITEVTPRQRRARKGGVDVAVTIGVAPHPNAKKGEVEIRVFFFDLTQNDEMRPTKAQVDYEWITPVRDWTDPTPKYLVATYLGPESSRESPERLRYGGFVVRVYFDGKLQAERSEPKGLVAALRSGGRSVASPKAAAPSPPPIAIAAPSPTTEERRSVEKEVVRNAAVATPIPASPPPIVTKREASTAPYASPVPDKPGFVYSPHNPKFLIDVRGFPPGTEVNDPNTGKPLRVP